MASKKSKTEARSSKKSVSAKATAKIKAKAGAKPAEEASIDLGYMGSREESADSRTLASRKRIRKQMGDEIEAFLARGGTINKIDPHVTADPPQKPTSNYGQRPI